MYILEIFFSLTVIVFDNIGNLVNWCDMVVGVDAIHWYARQHVQTLEENSSNGGREIFRLLTRNKFVFGDRNIVRHEFHVSVRT